MRAVGRGLRNPDEAIFVCTGPAAHMTPKEMLGLTDISLKAGSVLTTVTSHPSQRSVTQFVRVRVRGRVRARVRARVGGGRLGNAEGISLGEAAATACLRRGCREGGVVWLKRATRR